MIEAGTLAAGGGNCNMAKNELGSRFRADHNRDRVLAYIRRFGPVDIDQICEVIGVNNDVARNYLDHLLRHKLIEVANKEYRAGWAYRAAPKG